MRLFVDTEFTDFIDTQLISIGMITEDGREFYAEITDYNPKSCSQFVIANVLPLLGQPADAKKLTYAQCAVEIGNWIEGLRDQVEVCVDYSVDWEFVKDLVSDVWPTNLVKGYINIYGDLEREVLRKENKIRNAASLDDVMLERTPIHKVIEQQKAIFHDVFLQHFQDKEPNYKQHHALYDARANREGWIAGMKFVANL